MSDKGTLVDAKRIMCFGDSLTWGWKGIPEGVPVERYPYAERWTGAMHAALGDGYEIIEEGLSGRTTNADDPTDPRLNGSAYLPSALASHLPLDLVIIMLGTNDLKPFFHRTAHEIAAGMLVLITQVAQSAGGVGTAYPAPQVLVVAPPPTVDMPTPWFAELFKDARAKSIELAKQYKALTDFCGVPFLDAGDFIETDGLDGLHFSAAANITLGGAIAGKVKEILG